MITGTSDRVGDSIEHMLQLHRRHFRSPGND